MSLSSNTNSVVFSDGIKALLIVVIIIASFLLLLKVFEPQGEIPEEAASDQRSEQNESTEPVNDDETLEPEEIPLAATETALLKAEKTQLLISEFGYWFATDYLEGDINPGIYEVSTGDTLWEIAEAAYGDGALWTLILDANSADIGFLANGSQALIVPGQLLNIPPRL
ncbi:MAG: LysM peptidoglycan-binding domain-containing protein [Candidatus Dojkabacteria bacterium]|uniref:LysM domain/BON superfamily protein n=2 Tax=Candidatus Dojkabacteria TaxID=74243 RepID=A0A136KE31_9BACT|nr:MAG: LysM domain/BON superfamily protein [candidate division WS6 bacterium OLB21]MBW7953443.1 LysM peptidoglycan-binding domain-containing protein [Candidatus Dojkabacteria bacterium]WKZ28221.1 MAG: LysM peptidoglycan-binding domain-containing protein [Candidatus Dojkabacteria bacterium]